MKYVSRDTHVDLFLLRFDINKLMHQKHKSPNYSIEILTPC